MNPRRRKPRIRVLVSAVVATLALLVCCGGGAAAYFLSDLGTKSDSFGFGCGQNATQPGGQGGGQGGSSIDPNGTLPRVASLGAEEMRNAAIIIQVGQQLGVPPRGWVIAIATAMQESSLRNLTGGDLDSVGLFQQRPSQGWGSYDQVHDPVYASGKFYEKLIEIPGWQSMALTDAAQKVQGSAYPDAYAKHEPIATQIVNLLANGAARAVGNLVNLRCVNAGEIAASGWTVPVKAPIWSGRHTTASTSGLRRELRSTRHPQAS